MGERERRKGCDTEGRGANKELLPGQTKSSCSWLV